MVNQISMSAIPQGRPRQARAKPTLQAKVGPSEHSGYNEYRCSSHVVLYATRTGAKPICPVCEAERSAAFLQGQVDELTRANEMVQKERDMLQMQLDISTGILHAFDLAEGEDKALIKTVAYRWRSVEGDATKMVVSPLGMPKGRKTRPIGFVVVESGQSPFQYPLTSVGGLMVARLWSDARRMYGWKKAMDIFMQAVVGRLA